MLVSLSIENLAIIERVEIDFSEGMTVLSGETGAGKSIIIDALGLLCGGRGSTSYIRQGQERLLVEGLFVLEEVPKGLNEVLVDVGLDELDKDMPQLLLKREITTNGVNIIRVNGNLSNVTTLKRIGSFLVDIHGQNEHQNLLDASEHINLLDEYANLQEDSVFFEYQTSQKEFQKIRKDWLDAQKSEQEDTKRLSYLEFQWQELEDSNLVAGEYDELRAISKRLENAQQINQALYEVNYLLSNSDESALTQLSKASEALRNVQNFDDKYPAWVEQLDTLTIELQELAHDLALSESSFEPSDISIDEVQERLSELETLTRKYDKSEEELIAYQEELSEEIYKLKNREDYLAKLTTELKQAYQKAYELAKQLSTKRKEAAKTLESSIEEELSELYMANSRFKIKFEEEPTYDKKLSDIIEEAVLLSQDGIDQVEFYITTNPGEPFLPLVKVASGGELSRFMLALKAVFSRGGSSKTMVFDEIDTGVSGRVAQAIASKIYKISQKHQVLCITHLPQVAAASDRQLLIEKAVKDDKTYSKVIHLSKEARVKVIAEMLSGDKLTESSLQAARDLIDNIEY